VQWDLYTMDQALPAQAVSELTWLAEQLKTL
jgi:hypothetical protein